MTTIALDGEGNLQQQICRGLRDAISSGRIPANSRIAPSRLFAEDHGVSRNTVIAAYDQLIAEGYLETRRGAGTFVVPLAPIKEDKPSESSVAPTWSRLANRVAQDVPPELLLRQPRRKLQYDFLYGEPGYAELPLDRWARTIGRAARELTEAQLGYNPVAGLPELRQALSEYLGRSRGVVCDADQVFIVQGTQDAIDLAVRALVDEGTTAVLEEPRYRGFARCLLSAGATIRSIEVDDQGLQTAPLKGIENARIAFVTPSHQFPYGSIMSLARRQQLLAWAKERGTVIFEDDYDGEFRYEGRPIPSLQSLDESGLVIYAGTASKMLFPALRLGWMVVPRQMVETMQKLRSLSDSSGTILEQMAFSRFIQDGFLERHIHKMRRAQEQRRKVLLGALEQELGNLVQITGTEAGIHVLIKLLNVSAGRTLELIEQAAENGVGVYPTALFYTAPPKHAELLIGYASLTPEQIRVGIKRLAKVVLNFSR